MEIVVDYWDKFKNKIMNKTDIKKRSAISLVSHGKMWRAFENHLFKSSLKWSPDKYEYSEPKQHCVGEIYAMDSLQTN